MFCLLNTSDMGHKMKITKSVKILAWIVVCVFSTLSQAHTALKQSTPENGATVKATPEHIDLVFNGPVRLIKLDLKAADREMPTSFEVQADAVANYRIETLNMQTGQFTVEWAAIGADGHTITNTFSFTVDPNAISE